jgi:hypothetical protein
LLLEAGSDVFAKNSDSKTPRKVSNGNFLLTKLLRNYENNVLNKKFAMQTIQDTNNNCFTTVEDSSNVEDFSSFIKLNKVYKEERRDNPIIKSTVSEDLARPAIHKNDSAKFLKEMNLHLNKLKINSDAEEYENPFKKGSNNINTPIPPDRLSLEFSSNKSFGNSISKLLYITLDDTPQFFKNNLSKSGHGFNRESQVTVMQPKPKTVTGFGNSVSSLNNQRMSKINLFFHKEVILNYDNSLAEKYESIMYLRMASSLFNTAEIENVIRSIIECLDLDIQVNCVIFLDLCNLILVNQYCNLIPFLENIRKGLSERKGNFYPIIEAELYTLIVTLKSIQDNLKRQGSYAKTNTLPAKSNPQIKKKQNPKNIGIGGPMNKFIKNDGVDNSREEGVGNNKKAKKNNNLIPKLKSSSRFYDDKKDEKSQIDGFHSDDMNEISQSYIDLKYYNKQIPKRCSRNAQENQDSVLGESCNVVDSSYSILKHDDYYRQQSTYTARSKNDSSKMVDKQENDHYAIINPKNLETSYLDFENY